MDEPELRRRVVERPGEDGPRLEYAAWCEANGRVARAAFIRAQVERARVEAGSAEAERWFQEEMRSMRSRRKDDKWWKHYEGVMARYQARVGKARTSISFRDERGFVAGVGGEAPELVDVLEELCAVEPVDSLWLEWREEMGQEPLQRLAGMSVLGRMQSISGNAEPALMEALGRSQEVERVQRLTLWRQPWEKKPLEVEAFVRTLVEALQSGLAGVTRLELRGVALGPPGVGELCAEILVRGGWTVLSIDAAALGDAGAQILAEAPGLENVEALSVRENGLTAEGVRALVNAAGLRGVRRLDVGKNLIDAPGMQAVRERQGMPKLARLGVEESVREAVEEEWTEWTGAHLGSGKALRVMSARAVADRYPVAGVLLY